MEKRFKVVLLDATGIKVYGEGDWMAFGLIGDTIIYSRVHSLFNYLHSVQSQDLSASLLGVY